MMGEEMRTCMRIDQQCVRENAALLGFLAQGHVRLLTESDPLPEPPPTPLPEPPPISTLTSGQVDGRAVDAAQRRVAARATVRLLGRVDTSAPVLFLDQPLYAHHLSGTRAPPSLHRRLGLPSIGW